jgi:uncharacterized membrane protein
MDMKRHTLAACLIALAFLGIADSWYLAESAITNTALTCSIAGLDGCNVVAQSAYSHLFGIPIGVYGVVFYTIVFILGALLYVLPRRIIYHFITWIGTIGILASVLFLSLQIFAIRAICVYCLGSALITLLIFIVAILLFRRHAPKRVVTIPGS